MDMWYNASVQPRVRHSLQGGVAWNEEINRVWNELEHWYGRISLEVSVCREAEVARCRPGEAKLSSRQIWSTATDSSLPDAGTTRPHGEDCRGCVIHRPWTREMECVRGCGQSGYGAFDNGGDTDIWQLGKISDH